MLFCRVGVHLLKSMRNHLNRAYHASSLVSLKEKVNTPFLTQWICSILAFIITYLSFKSSIIRCPSANWMCNLNVDISRCVTSSQNIKVTITFNIQNQPVRSNRSYWLHCLWRWVFSDAISRHFFIVQGSDFSLQGSMILIIRITVLFWLCNTVQWTLLCMQTLCC